MKVSALFWDTVLDESHSKWLRWFFRLFCSFDSVGETHGERGMWDCPVNKEPEEEESVRLGVVNGILPGIVWFRHSYLFWWNAKCKSVAFRMISFIHLILVVILSSRLASQIITRSLSLSRSLARLFFLVNWDSYSVNVFMPGCSYWVAYETSKHSFCRSNSWLR